MGTGEALRRGPLRARRPAPLHIVDYLTHHLQGGEVVMFMSNGGFGGIHAKLLEALERQ
jgi:UDP-N-acetylmuramate-alanine ligase